MSRAGDDWSAKTAVSARRASSKSPTPRRDCPTDFTPHPKLKRLLERARAMVDRQAAIDWGCGEMLALGTLLLEGDARPLHRPGRRARHVQPSPRRPARLQRRQALRPARNIWPTTRAAFTIVNTMLSELAVLGFEYGFTLGRPARPGDLGSAVRRLRQRRAADHRPVHRRRRIEVAADERAGACFLPHGYEGQGPEHSNAYLERFLQLCAENNMQVCIPTHAGAIFPPAAAADAPQLPQAAGRDDAQEPAALRAIGLAASRSSRDGTFQLVIDDPAVAEPRQRAPRAACARARCTTRSGRAREKPTPRTSRSCASSSSIRSREKEIEASHRRRTRQAQGDRLGAGRAAEPAARGASWSRGCASCCPGMLLAYVGRDEAASPATGSFKMHQIEEAGTDRQAHACADRRTSKARGAREAPRRRLATRFRPQAFSSAPFDRPDNGSRHSQRASSRVGRIGHRSRACSGSRRRAIMSPSMSRFASWSRTRRPSICRRPIGGMLHHVQARRGETAQVGEMIARIDR